MTLLRSCAVLLAASCAVALSAANPVPKSVADEPHPDAFWVYFGTYTGGKGESKGIYRRSFDTKTGKSASRKSRPR